LRQRSQLMWNMVSTMLHIWLSRYCDLWCLCKILHSLILTP
jgi:hypothetical protein